MHILTVGFNHQTAPIELREQFTFSDQRLKMAATHLRNMKSILECVIVSTCNRMELYVVADQQHTGEYYSKAFLESWFRIPQEEFKPYLYVKTNETSIEHLFHVVAGLDSLVLGETQILGQVKTAFAKAKEAEATGTIFHKLFQQAIAFGKRVHAETEIGTNAVSVGYAAVELARKMYSSLDHKTIVLLGAGKMAELTAKYFADFDQTNVKVLNRTKEKADYIANQVQGQAHPWSELSDVLTEADIVISSTSSSEFILTRSMVEPLISIRKNPLFFIDIALPRDIDPTIHDLDQVYLYNLDDLNGIVDQNKGLRKQEAKKVTQWIQSEVENFQEWVQMLGVIPLISALRSKALTVQEEVMQRIERKLPDLSEKERRVLRKQTKSIINQLLRDPIDRVKELSATPQQEEVLDLFVHLFALEDYIDQEQQEQSERMSALAVGFKEAYS